MLPAMMVPCWWRQMHAQSALVQSQAEPSWQEGSDIQFLPTRIVRFSELNKRQDEFFGNHDWYCFLLDTLPGSTIPLSV